MKNLLLPVLLILILIGCKYDKLVNKDAGIRTITFNEKGEITSEKLEREDFSYHAWFEENKITDFEVVSGGLIIQMTIMDDLIACYQLKKDDTYSNITNLDPDGNLWDREEIFNGKKYLFFKDKNGNIYVEQ